MMLTVFVIHDSRPDPMPVDFTLRRYRRSRSLRIRVDGDGRVRVTAPLRVSLRFIEQFVQSRADWVQAARDRIALRPASMVGTGSPIEYKQHKAAALAVAHRRVAHFSAIYGLPVGKISIRNQRSRWGSCSSRGNISFNYRIIFLPPELQDYLVVHELCHIAQPNHSAKFWLLVAKAIPDFQHSRKALTQLL